MQSYLPPAHLQWFAVRTKSNRETVVTDSLESKGLKAWCPRYSNIPLRSPAATKPVFPGYVFCQFDVQHRLPILTSPGVVNIVSNGRVPLPIEDKEMESLRIVMRSMIPVMAHDFLRIGDAVRITEGPLAGAEGFIVRTLSERLIVSITLLQRSIAVAVESSWIEKSFLAGRS